MKLRKAIILGLAAFLLALLLVLPASWVGKALPPGVQCARWAGSIWRGQCGELTVRDSGTGVMRIDSLRWKLRPLSLLRLNLSAEFDGRWAKGQAQGLITVAPGGVIRLRELDGASLLDRSVVRSLPEGWNGRAELRDVEFDWNAGTLGRLGGELTIDGLADARGNALGSYHLQLAPAEAPPFNGHLRDTGGPLEVDAQLQLAANRSWSLEGRMRARNPSDQALGRKLDMFAAADASGWRRLSAAGDFN
jgi:hypothetical protein